jgi:surface antigen
MHKTKAGHGYIGLATKCKIKGDFDVQIDFSLAVWPAANFHTVRLMAQDLPEGLLGKVGVYRNSYNTENYQLRGITGVVAETSRFDQSGKLRLRRVHNVIQGFYWNGTEFVAIGSVLTTTDDTGFTIDFSGGPTSVGANLLINVDNFHIDSGSERHGRDDYPASLRASPWPNVCPDPGGTVDEWGFCARNCTSFVAWRMHQAGIRFFNTLTGPGDARLGDAARWAERLDSIDWEVNGTPAVGAIAHWNATDGVGVAGHVAYVTGVNADGSVVVEDYNWNRQGTYGTRSIAKAFRYIHPPSVPGKPTAFADVSGNHVTLNWSASPGIAPTSYFVSVGTASGASNVFAQNVGLATSGSGFLPNGTYFIRVTAINALGSATSNEIAITIGSSLVPPGPPSKFRTFVSGATLSLSWDAPTTGGPPTTYVIEAGSFIGANNLANFSTGSTATSFVASNVPAGTYYARVRAKNGSGTSAPSNEGSFTVGQTGGLARIDIVGGTLSTPSGVLWTAFGFDPFVPGAVSPMEKVVIDGPPGWNSGRPFNCIKGFGQPSGTAPNRVICWANTAPLSGAYSARGFAGAVSAASTVVVNAAQGLSGVRISQLNATAGQVSFQWTAPSAAQSFQVRLSRLPFAGDAVLDSFVLPANARSATFSNLALTAGVQYLAEVYAFSLDMRTPGPIMSPFNIGADTRSFSVTTGPSTLPPFACGQERSLRSIEGVTLSAIEFVNNRFESVKIYWLDYQGQRRFWGTLNARRAYVQGAYLTHPWVVTDLLDRCLAIFLPAPTQARAIIQ